MNSVKEITTSDLGLATFLSVKGCKIIEVVEKDGQYQFKFLDDKKREGNLLNDYFNRELNENSLVPALEFNERLRSLKTMCHTRFKNMQNVKNAIKRIADDDGIDIKMVQKIIDNFYKFSEV